MHPTSPSPSARRLWTRREWLGVTCASLVLSGCDRLRKLSLHRALPLRGTIHALVWDGYLPQEVLDEFQAKTGIRVVLDLFSSNDQLVDLLRARAQPYDLVMPSSFMGPHLRELDLIKPLRRERLPNLEKVDRLGFRTNFDPNNNYLVPYIWGTTGIGYNVGRVDGLPKSWGDLFVQRRRPDGTIPGVSILNDARFSLGTVLLYQGKFPSTATAGDVEAAGDVLIKLRERISHFESDNVAELLAENSVDLAMAWSADVGKAMLGWPDPFHREHAFEEDHPAPAPDGRFQGNKGVRLSLPTEGAILFTDCFGIPRQAENQAEAEEFLNYLLDPTVAAQVTNYSLYATTIPASHPLVNRFILNGPAFFRHPVGLRHNFTLEGALSIDHVYQSVWARVKSTVGSPLPPLELPVAPPAANPA